jgi:epoxyqueuosine reductase
MAQDEIGSAGIAQKLRVWGASLGFSQIGISGIDLSNAEAGLLGWLEAGFHGDMAYMADRGLLRARPGELVPGTVSVITARMDYLPPGAKSDLGAASAADWRAIEWQGLSSPDRAMVSLYARGRDYHKVLRARLKALAERLAEEVGPLGYRVFTDSAPVLEVELAQRSGIGWRGKHTLALSREAGSMFFLGEIFVDLALPESAPVSEHCGSCSACITACPTGAIVAPYRLDARRCISYLTIEHAGPIDEALRPLIGNRIYGCDDCQLACPWNKYAQPSTVGDFASRPPLGSASLLTLWQWGAAEFERHTEGSAIRRIGLERWRRNLAVALGNALAAASPQSAEMRAALNAALPEASALVAEHIVWALAQRPAPSGGSTLAGAEPQCQA